MAVGSDRGLVKPVADGLHGKKVGVLGEKGRGDLAPTVGVSGFESGLQGAKSDASAQLWECTSDFAVSRDLSQGEGKTTGQPATNRRSNYYAISPDLDQGGEENKAGPAAGGGASLLPLRGLKGIGHACRIRLRPPGFSTRPACGGCA